MTEFEQQVAETLFRLMRDWPMSDPYTGPSEQFLNRLAPRVAAAILAAREKCAELTQGAVVLASVHGSTLPADAPQQVEVAALAALRGEP